MFNNHDLRELLDFVSPSQVLSLYLNTDPIEGNADAYRLRLKTMLKEINLPQDVKAIERYFNHEFDWSGRSIAVFSCAAKEFFRAYPLAVPMRNLVQISDRPIVKPLADLMDTYGGYGVVLVDKQGARLFYFHLGQLREQEGVVGETIRHTKHGGASSLPGRRSSTAGKTDRMDERVERNMRDSAEFAVHFFEENQVRRVLIGGTDENVHAFRTFLPKAWQSLIMGTFSMPMTASHTEVGERALEIGIEVAQQSDLRLVDDLITGASKQNGAVAGLAATFDAINRDQVRTLVFTEGLRKDGYICSACGGLFVTKADEICPLCSQGKLERTLDGIVLAVKTVMRRGGEVNVVRAAPALEKVEGMGALLRY